MSSSFSRWAARALLTLFLILGGVLGLGCGTTCEQIASNRDAFRQMSAEPTERPHLVAALPLSLANEIIAPQVMAIEPMPLEIPGAGVMGQFLTGMTLRPRQVELLPTDGAHDGGVGIEVILDISQSGDALFSMTVRGVIRPELDVEQRRVAVVLRAVDFHSMEPRLDPDASERLATTLHGLLPSMAQMLIPPGGIAAGARIITEIVLSQSYPLLREGLFSRLGPLARIEVSLPELPIERMSFSTVANAHGGHLILEAYTPLPVDGVGVPETVELTPSAGAELLLTGPSIAAFANWAMVEGQIPRRFDEGGQASENGPFEAALAWGRGERPLLVHIWRLEDRCLRAILSAGPELRVEGEELVLEIHDPTMEELEGPPFAGLVRLFSRLWIRAMRRTQTTAASLELSVGGRPLQGQITSARLDGDLLRMTLDLGETVNATEQ